MKGKQSMRHCNARLQNKQQHTKKKNMTRQRKRPKTTNHSFAKVQMGNCAKIRKLSGQEKNPQRQKDCWRSLYCKNTMHLGQRWGKDGS